MKKTTIAALMLAPVCAMSQVIGLHIGSQHTNDPHGLANNLNPGLYVRFERNGEIDAAITQAEEAQG